MAVHGAQGASVRQKMRLSKSSASFTFRDNPKTRHRFHAPVKADTHEGAGVNAMAGMGGALWNTEPAAVPTQVYARKQ